MSVPNKTENSWKSGTKMLNAFEMLSSLLLLTKKAEEGETVVEIRFEFRNLNSV